MFLRKAIEGFLIARTADGYSPETLKMYRWALGLMNSHLGEREVSDIGPEDLERFWTWLRVDYKPRRMNGDLSPLSGRSLENVWTASRSFFNWASETFNLNERPDLKIRRPRYKPEEISPLSQEDTEKLVNACSRSAFANTARRTTFTMPRSTSHRDVALILVLLDTGLRVSECARLKVRDVNLTSGEVFVEAWGTGQKTKSRHVYLGKSAKKALWRYLADREDLRPDEPLFASDIGRSMNRTSIRQLLVRLGKKAGLNDIHPHRFRHTFAVEYLRNGGDVFTLQRMLGHSTLEMVRHYLALAEADSAEAHRRASPADRWRL